MKSDVLEAFNRFKEDATRFVCVTFVSKRGEAPGKLGEKIIVTSDGLEVGTIGGGKVEARAIAHAVEMLESADSSSPQLMIWNLQTEIGMSCGGEVTLLFERVENPRWEIALFGAGHVSQALVPVLATLQCQITCIDSREDWLNRFEKRENLTLVCSEHPPTEISRFAKETFFVVMTQGHATDLPILEAILKANAFPTYIGAIGSEQKASKLKKELLERGVSKTSLEKLHCPIGLKIGNNDPSEIAISIVAELLRVRDEAFPR